MKNDIINKLTSGEYIDEKNGVKICVPIEKIEIESGAIRHIEGFLKGKKFKKIAVVSDENTHLAAGAEIERILCSNRKYEISSVVLPEDVYADMDNVEMLSAYSIGSELLIAVGGGTINDLCKYSSFKSSKKYISVPTCPSVNGFTSANASISEDGLKKTFAAQLPIAVFMDVDVIVQSPERLIISGFGDCLARSTSQADWMLANFMIGTEYDNLPFEILAEEERYLFENAEKLLNKDYQALQSLCRLLILSGMGMYLAGSSMPASQSEHLISHYMELFFEEKYKRTFHGEQIAVTASVMAKIQEDILKIENPSISELVYSEKPVLKHFGQERGGELLSILKNKEISEGNCDNINQNLNLKWCDLKEEISKIFISYDKMEKMLKAIKGPYTYKHLGWEYDDFQQAIQNAAFLRDRFTFLDFAMCLNQEVDLG